MWNLKHDTNKLIIKQKQTHRHRKQPYGIQRRRKGSLRLADTYYYIENKQQGPPV